MVISRIIQLNEMSVKIEKLGHMIQKNSYYKEKNIQDSLSFIKGELYLFLWYKLKLTK